LGAYSPHGIKRNAYKIVEGKDDREIFLGYLAVD
jgi:hypothetical protein